LKIARNILLLSWLIDQKPIDDVINARNWAAYYSVLVDSDCFEAIRERATLLTTISSTLSDWDHSEYGQIIRVTDSETLAQVRKFWVKYSSLATLPSKKLQDIRERFMQEFRQIRNQKVKGFSLSGMRSVGAPGLNAMESVTKEFDRFWETGVVGGLPEFTETATYINPLFVYSNIGGDQCLIHYGTDPILGFHCAAAFAETLPSSKLSESLTPYTKTSSLEENVHRLARTAVLEFKSWCVAFKSVADPARNGEPSSLAIHNFRGDAVKFCYSLQSVLGKIDATANLFHTCAAPWNCPLNFSPNSGFVCQYDVIDTSNLADHVGLLNVLTCALPLLKASANAVLYTENLAYITTGDSDFKRLRSLLCGNPASMFCLLRAAPMECLTGVSTNCSLYEAANFQHIFGDAPTASQLRWRFSWKDIVLGDERVSSVCKAPLVPFWDTDALAQTVVSLYNEMFRDENFSSIFQKPTSNAIAIPTRFYTRAGFVAFLALVRRRHQTMNWSEFFLKFIELVSIENPVSLQSHGAQELFLQLHVQRLYTPYVLRESLKSSAVDVPDSWPDIYHNSALPHSVPLLFRIPHSQLQHILGEFNPVEAESDLVFQVTLSTPPVSNSYSVIQATFGSNFPGLPPNWNNPRDLIVYFQVPAWTVLTVSRKTTTISLRLHVDSWTIRKFVLTLGPEMIIFQTSIWNSEFVMPKVAEQLPSVPDISGHVTAPTMLSTSGFHVLAPKFSTGVNGQLEWTTHITITGNNKTKLAAGDKVEITQNSPCTFRVHLGTSTVEIALPFPALASTARIRVARKSGWIEVITPIITSPSESSFNFTRFPVIKQAAGSYYPWNMSRLYPEVLPRLKLSTKNDLSWINTNVSGSFSSRERLLREKHTKDITTGDNLVDLKDGIFSLFMNGAGIGSSGISKSTSGPTTFFLDMEGGGIMTIIFLVGIRLDTNDATVVADSYVLPLVPELVAIFGKELFALSQKGGVTLKCSTAEYELWTLFLKASVERSRSWTHKSNCPGKLQDQSHQTFGHLQQFLCRCGAGKMIQEFAEVNEWRPFKPFVTRCLFTPLFPVQSMEPIVIVNPDLKEISNPAGRTEWDTTEEKICLTCKARGGVENGQLLICTRCRKATYCSKSCQKKDWKQHKIICRA